MAGKSLPADGVVTARLPETYQWMLVPVQTTPQSAVTWQPVKLSEQEALAVRASKRLKSDELLLASFAATRLRMELDSMPTEIDQLERQIQQLEIEQSALKKEKDEASRERLKKLEKDKVVSEDQRKVAETSLQALTDSHIKKIDDSLAAKEKDIMEV